MGMHVKSQDIGGSCGDSIDAWRELTTIVKFVDMGNNYGRVAVGEKAELGDNKARVSRCFICSSLGWRVWS